MVAESKLLDAIEDAQEELARVRTQVTLYGLGLTGSLLAGVTAGILGSLGILSGLVVFLWFVTGTGVLGFGSLLLADVADEEVPDAKKKLRTAQRAHRDFLMNQS